MFRRDRYYTMKLAVIAGAITGAVLFFPLLAVHAAEPASAAQEAAEGIKDGAVGIARQAEQAAEGVVTSTTRQERDQAAKERLEQKEEKQSAGEYLDDAGITAKVKAGLAAEKDLASFGIKVITVNGAVTLLGDVKTFAQVGLAESVAKKVEGVRSVENRLVAK